MKNNIAQRCANFMTDVGENPEGYFPPNGWRFPKPRESIQEAVLQVRNRVIQVEISLRDGMTWVRTEPASYPGMETDLVIESTDDDGGFLDVIRTVHPMIGRQTFHGGFGINYNSSGKLKGMEFNVSNNNGERIQSINAVINPEGLLKNHSSITQPGKTYNMRPQRQVALRVIQPDTSNAAAALSSYWRGSEKHPDLIHLMTFPLRLEKPEDIFEIVRGEVREIVGPLPGGHPAM